MQIREPSEQLFHQCDSVPLIRLLPKAKSQLVLDPKMWSEVPYGWCDRIAAPGAMQRPT
jgi:hypothetical protein